VATLQNITFNIKEDEMFCIFQIKKLRVLCNWTAEYTQLFPNILHSCC